RVVRAVSAGAATSCLSGVARGVRGAGDRRLPDAGDLVAQGGGVGFVAASVRGAGGGSATIATRGSGVGRRVGVGRVLRVGRAGRDRAGGWVSVRVVGRPCPVRAGRCGWGDRVGGSACSAAGGDDVRDRRVVPGGWRDVVGGGGGFGRVVLRGCRGGW